MKKFTKLAIVIIAGLSINACGGGDGPGSGSVDKTAAKGGNATITIDGTAHHFPKVECFKGFNDDLMVVLKNSELYFEVGQLEPKQNTWTVKYYRGSFASGGNIHQQRDQSDEYFTREYDVTRNGNKITGTAMTERGKLPRNPVDITIDVTCQKL